MDFWMLWVAGRGAPTRMYPTHEDAMRGVEYLKQELGITREIYVLKPHAVIPGRKLLTLNSHPKRSKVEPQPAMIIGLDDLRHERRIRGEMKAFLKARRHGNAAKARHHLGEFNKLIGERSPEQVSKMENARGFDRV